MPAMPASATLGCDRSAAMSSRTARTLRRSPSVNIRRFAVVGFPATSLGLAALLLSGGAATAGAEPAPTAPISKAPVINTVLGTGGLADSTAKGDTSALWHGGVLLAGVALLAAAIATLVVLWRRSRGGLTFGTVAIGIWGAMFGIVVGFIVGFFVGAYFGSAWIPGVPEGRY